MASIPTSGKKVQTYDVFVGNLPLDADEVSVIICRIKKYNVLCFWSNEINIGILTDPAILKWGNLF